MVEDRPASSRCKFCLILLTYAVVSILLTLGFKHSFSVFNFPLSLMALLLTVEAVIVRLGTSIASCCIKGFGEEEEVSKSWTLVGAVGLFVAFEIGLSNLGLMMMTVASHTMIKASTPLFVLCASLFLGLEKPSFCIFLIVALVSAGTTLCSLGRLRVAANSTAPQQQLRGSIVGILLTVAACMAGGMRWGCTQLLTQQHGTRPRLLIVKTLPISAASLALLAAVVEGPAILDSTSHLPLGELLVYALLLALAGLIVLWTEVLMVSECSSLSLAIIATTKELLLLFISVVGLNEKVSQLGMGGFFVTTVGIVFYNLHKLDQSDEHGRRQSGGDDCALLRRITSSSTSSGYRQVSTFDTTCELPTIDEEDPSSSSSPSQSSSSGSVQEEDEEIPDIGGGDEDDDDGVVIVVADDDEEDGTAIPGRQETKGGYKTVVVL